MEYQRYVLHYDFFAYLNSYFVILAMAKVAIQIHFTGQSPGYFLKEKSLKEQHYCNIS